MFLFEHESISGPRLEKKYLKNWESLRVRTIVVKNTIIQYENTSKNNCGQSCGDAVNLNLSH